MICKKIKDERCLWVLPGEKKFVILISGLLNAIYSTQLSQHIYQNCYFSLTFLVWIKLRVSKISASDWCPGANLNQGDKIKDSSKCHRTVLFTPLWNVPVLSKYLWTDKVQQKNGAQVEACRCLSFPLFSAKVKPQL